MNFTTYKLLLRINKFMHICICICIYQHKYCKSFQALWTFCGTISRLSIIIHCFYFLYSTSLIYLYYKTNFSQKEKKKKKIWRKNPEKNGIEATFSSECREYMYILFFFYFLDRYNEDEQMLYLHKKSK